LDHDALVVGKKGRPGMTRITIEGPNTDVIEGKAFDWGDMLAWRKMAENRFSIAMGIIKELLAMYDHQRRIINEAGWAPGTKADWVARRAFVVRLLREIGGD